MKYFSIWFLVLFVSETVAQMNYITWDDLTVNQNNSKSLVGKNRVIVVNKNGGGDSKTVQGAVDMVPQNNGERVKIHVLPGVYSEKVHVPASKPYVSFIGDPNDATKTVIKWDDKASDSDGKGGTVGTWNSASVTVESNYFCAAGITFQNTVFSKGVQGEQAVALRISGDKSMLYKVSILGSQDTLLDETGTHYFLQCFIEGAIDFIFGSARSLYQECTLSVVGYAYAITAQRRNSANEDTGFSFVNCILQGTGPILLGRAWGDYSRVMFLHAEFKVRVSPEGWSDWGVSSRRNTVEFGEYNCTGTGANRSGRVPWSKLLTDAQAKPYLDTTFIDGKTWLRL